MGNKLIFLADDHQLILDSLSTVIAKTEPKIVIKTAQTHNKIKKLFDEYGSPDLLLLDYNMPDMPKLEIFKKYTHKLPNQNIAILSGTANQQDISEFIDKGFAGYIPKSLSVDAIIGAIKLILSGSRYIPFDEYISNKRKKNALTQKERHILEMVTKGNTNKEIANTLFVEEITVKVYIKKLCEKINARNRTELASKSIIENLF